MFSVIYLGSWRMIRTFTDERAARHTDERTDGRTEPTNERASGRGRVAIETLILSLSHPRHAAAIPATGGRKNSEGEKPGGDSNKKTDQY